MIQKALLYFFVVATFSAQAQNARLPPKDMRRSQESTLGDSQAVREAQQLNTDNRDDRTEMSGAVAPINISSSAVESLSTPEADTEAKTPQAQDVEAPVQPLPQARSWIVLDKKPELGFITGWAFTRKDLATLVGSGFAYGVMAAQEFQPQVQLQLRLTGSHHGEKNSFRKSSLNLFPFEVLAQFSKDYGPFRFYVQPGLGTALWFAKTERLVDSRIQKTHGFDFMASGGLGMQYRLPNNPWRVGADMSLAYVSGYFDNYFNRILVYTSYQF